MEASETMTEDEGLRQFARHMSIPPENLPNLHLLRMVIHKLGGFPLAVRLMSIWAANHPDQLTANLIDRLDQNKACFMHLELREECDRHPDLESILLLIYTDMNADLRRRFRALGMFPPDSVLAAEAAAALWGDTNQDVAGDALNQLARIGLLDQPVPGLFLQPRMIGSYACGLLRCPQEWLSAEDERQTASYRHMAYFAAFARQHANPEHIHLLATQMPNLVLAYNTALAQSNSHFLYEIVWFTESALELLGLWEQRESWLRTALNMLQGSSPETIRREAQLHGVLAEILAKREAAPEAEVMLHQARAGFETVGDEHSVAITKGRLAEMAAMRGAWDEAESLLREARETFELLGDDTNAGFVNDSLASLPGHDVTGGTNEHPSHIPETPLCGSNNLEALDEEAINRLMSGMRSHLDQAWEAITPDEMLSTRLTMPENAGSDIYGGVPGEFIELRLPPIMEAYKQGGESAVREHLNQLGMSEDVVRQVMLDLPMLLEQEGIDNSN